jgi:hypothetical protein
MTVPTSIDAGAWLGKYLDGDPFCQHNLRHLL